MMNRAPQHIASLLLILIISSCKTSPGTFREVSRIYSPDSSKFILRYEFAQGAWDGGRTTSVAIVDAAVRVDPAKIKQAYSSLDIDSIYWEGNDTIVVDNNYTDYINLGKPALRDTMINGVAIKVALKDPIDSSFTRKIFFRQISPDKKYELIVYKYVKPINGYYFLNISIINSGDSIPKFGNFYISRNDFDCFTDIRWDSHSILDIQVNESCYHSFAEYLVRKRPEIKYKVSINDTIVGNIRPYMQ